MQDNRVRELSKQFAGLVQKQFSVYDFDGIHGLATYLSQFFPNPSMATFGIHEMILNAFEHGNLGIGYDLKSELIKIGEWEQEIRRRQALPENSKKEVLVECFTHEDRSEILVQDRGNGFEWHRYLDADNDRIHHTHGRGIMLARMLSFDKIDYSNNGTTVLCTSYFPKS